VNHNYQNFLTKFIQQFNHETISSKLAEYKEEQIFTEEVSQMKTMLLYDYLNFGNQMDLAHQLNLNLLDYDLFETVISQYQYYNYFGNVFEDINWDHSNQDEMLDLFGKIYFMICGFRINVNISQQGDLNEIYSQRLDDFFFSRMNFVLDKL
jgi:hypothetical protein